MLSITLKNIIEIILRDAGNILSKLSNFMNAILKKYNLLSNNE